MLRRRRGLIPQVAVAFVVVWILYSLSTSNKLPNGHAEEGQEARRDGEGREEKPETPRAGLAKKGEHSLEKELEKLKERMGQEAKGQGVNEGLKQEIRVGALDRPQQEQHKPKETDPLPPKPAEPQQVQQMEPPGNHDKPGEGGKPFIIDKDKLSPKEREEYDLGWKNNAYNQYASDRISLHRSLEDTRGQECKTKKYRPNHLLPNSSVVVIFHNEGWSVLLRTVHSIIDRSPPELLHEVIMVDDHSDMAHLQKPLDDYVSGLAKVKLIRAQRREGLIRARLLGAAAATGEILVFLDSHCEPTPGWLEPLADRIADDWSNVLVPVINTISDETLQYYYTQEKDVSVGGFTWNLIFTWISVPKAEKAANRSVADPVRSPTMAGGLFAVNRKYFEYIGTYDAGMEIWGGENLELSFRVWMCGGRLETIPCSRVGHIFRKRSPYKWQTDKTAKGASVVNTNNMRLAEVWLDEYKEVFYEHIGRAPGNYGDISSRVALRKRLQCKSFKWFLDNIYPSAFVPSDCPNRGEVRNQGLGDRCLDAQSEMRELYKAAFMYPCHGQGGNQYWVLSKTGEMRRDNICLDYSHGAKSATTYPCHGMRGNQEWLYTEAMQLKHQSTGLCMEPSGNDVIMVGCDAANAKQKWTFKRTALRPNP